ncbi:arginyl-tRNA-protein transferase [Suhomyces tanzawaensis NRRL Y-17324]|uniref:arginyltransferase n=1 Tax=Suhomyces tanzawaensis NRRL Y-17324 TaxID=984487 RepID=A0A1E4SJJ1_9ASCO|nr:arginyl-tRNA-protein transferase [Suhomyces tanzawaensis NRRL Y-17324]ODV79673.1 arginyl-tRNA-protein transferase [Suhomyces tanzawaensis NRRL Y-17324]
MVAPSPDLPMVLTRLHYIVDKDCGYCGGKKEDHSALESGKQDASSESVILGTSVEQMTCRHYDELVNQGFRRSGSFLYKPDLLRGCCRLYTIRTNKACLKLNKQQRKVVNRFVREIAPQLEEGKEKHKNQAKYDLDVLALAQEKSTRFHTRFEPSKFSKEKFQLYKKYQISVHNDPPEKITEQSFKRFLCDNPFLENEIYGTPDQWNTLEKWFKPSGGGKKRIGPTHECYYLDNKLIAVSVLDFLPSGVSSIYFIWDPDYAHLSLGTVSGIREILMCERLGFEYYYLGYYIDDCDKMRYKLKFGGELLDLCNELYVPFETAKPFIKNGRLFVIGDEDDEFVEPEMENNGHPETLEESEYNEKTLINIAEGIYGSKEVFDTAENSKKVLEQIYGIKSEASPFEIPSVLPGAIPLWQIVEWFESEIINNQFPVSLFRMMTSELLECTFGELKLKEKLIVVDFIRVFGLDKVQDAIILV